MRVFFHFPGALLSVSSCPSLALTFLLYLFLCSSPSVPFSFSLSLPPPPPLSLSLALLKNHSFCPSNVDHCHHPWCALKEKNKLKTALKSSFSCCLNPVSCAILLFLQNPQQKIHVPGYMLKFILQLAKLCISFYNLKALCEQTSWLTHVANYHDVIDLLSCNSILDHFQTSSFYSTAVDRAWFFTSN